MTNLRRAEVSLPEDGAARARMSMRDPGSKAPG